MTFQQFKMSILLQPVTQELRVGQFVFLELSKVNKDLSDRLIYDEVSCDPYNNDDRLPAFWQFIKDNWEN